MKCDNCKTTITGNEYFEYAGKRLCEDCYLDIKAAPKTCDPWAVYSAKNLPKHHQNLTPLQQKILTFLKEKKAATSKEICKALNIEEKEFEANFSTLRHLELAKATKKDNEIYYTLFED